MQDIRAVITVDDSIRHIFEVSPRPIITITIIKRRAQQNVITLQLDGGRH